VKIVCRTGPVDRELDSSIKVGNAVGYTNSSVHYSYKVWKEGRVCEGVSGVLKGDSKKKKMI